MLRDSRPAKGTDPKQHDEKQDEKLWGLKQHA